MIDDVDLKFGHNLNFPHGLVLMSGRSFGFISFFTMKLAMVPRRRKATIGVIGNMLESTGSFLIILKFRQRSEESDIEAMDAKCIRRWTVAL